MSLSEDSPAIRTWWGEELSYGELNREVQSRIERLTASSHKVALVDPSLGTKEVFVTTLAVIESGAMLGLRRGEHSAAEFRRKAKNFKCITSSIVVFERGLELKPVLLELILQISESITDLVVLEAGDVIAVQPEISSLFGLSSLYAALESGATFEVFDEVSVERGLELLKNQAPDVAILSASVFNQDDFDLEELKETLIVLVDEDSVSESKSVAIEVKILGIDDW